MTGGEVGERLVPLFVDGEYATSRATPEAEPTVRLTIRVTQGDRRLETVSPGPVTEAEVVSVLAERLPRKLVRMAESGDGVPLDRSRQFALLAQRAEAFSELGQWPQSTSLREAALLLQPQSVEQRLRLIREYRRWAGHYFLFRREHCLARWRFRRGLVLACQTRTTAAGSRASIPASGPQHRDGRRLRPPPSL